MAQIKIENTYKVELTEYYRFSGSKVYEKLYFDNEKEARDYCKNFNAKNNEDRVPDYYERADYCGKI